MGDVNRIFFGPLGEAQHYAMDYDVAAGKTEGTLTVELHPQPYVQNDYVISVSLGDMAGHFSNAMSAEFRIARMGGSGGSAGLNDAGTRGDCWGPWYRGRWYRRDERQRG